MVKNYLCVKIPLKETPLKVKYIKYAKMKSTLNLNQCNAVYVAISPMIAQLKLWYPFTYWGRYRTFNEV